MHPIFRGQAIITNSLAAKKIPHNGSNFPCIKALRAPKPNPLLIVYTAMSPCQHHFQGIGAFPVQIVPFSRTQSLEGSY